MDKDDQLKSKWVRKSARTVLAFLLCSFSAGSTFLDLFSTIYYIVFLVLTEELYTLVTVVGPRAIGLPVTMCIGPHQHHTVAIKPSDLSHVGLLWRLAPARPNIYMRNFFSHSEMARKSF